MEPRDFILIICELATREKVYNNVVARVLRGDKLNDERQQTLLHSLSNILVVIGLRQKSTNVDTIRDYDIKQGMRICNAISFATRNRTEWRPETGEADYLVKTGVYGFFQDIVASGAILDDYDVLAMLALLRATTSAEKITRVLRLRSDRHRLRAPSDVEMTAYAEYVKKRKQGLEEHVNLVRAEDNPDKPGRLSLNLMTGGGDTEDVKMEFNSRKPRR